MAGVVEEEAAAVGVQAANPNVLLTEVSALQSRQQGARRQKPCILMLRRPCTCLVSLGTSHPPVS